MLKKSHQLNYVIHENHQSLSSEIVKLIEHANAALVHAHAPYSQFKVAAAGLTLNNTYITGANIENAAYPQCLCAEMVMMSNFKMRDECQALKAVAVLSAKGSDGKPIAPCGACRQILIEQELAQDRAITLYLLNSNHRIYEIPSIRSILPFSFSAEHLTQPT